MVQPWNTDHLPGSGDTAPGYKTGTFIQILQADASGNGIGYNERNFTLVDEADPTYIFNNEGRYVVYKFYAYYIEGEEDNWSTPADIEKTYYNIDGSAPEELKLSAEVDGSTTILNDLTGGLFFKEPITIIPQGEIPSQVSIIMNFSACPAAGMPVMQSH